MIKLDLDDIIPSVLIPPDFLGIPTDVIEVGRFGRIPQTDSPPDPTERDPIQPGSPIRFDTDASNVNAGAAGTLGAVVVAGSDRYILSCNHVLSVNGRLPEGTPIVSAASIEVGTNPAVIARSAYYVPIARDQPNDVDCALARIINGKVQAGFPEKLGWPKFPSGDAYGPPAVGAMVRKAGAVTGLTYGIVVDVNADFFVDYSFGTFRFANQIVIDGNIPGQADDVFASEGDSGAILVDANQQAVGVVFAEADRFALACPLWKVLDQFRRQFNLNLDFVRP
jgi:hypothetical protein